MTTQRLGSACINGRTGTADTFPTLPPAQGETGSCTPHCLSCSGNQVNPAWHDHSAAPSASCLPCLQVRQMCRARLHTSWGCQHYGVLCCWLSQAANRRAACQKLHPKTLTPSLSHSLSRAADSSNRACRTPCAGATTATTPAQHSRHRHITAAHSDGGCCKQQACTDPCLLAGPRSTQPSRLLTSSSPNKREHANNSAAVLGWWPHLNLC